jgi:hypothetical protein
VAIPEWVRARTNKWNRVVGFAANPCDAPLAIWFETFRPAAGKAAVTLLSFGLDDVARGYFRPKGVYPRKCIGRRRRPRSAVGIPELGEEIGKRLPAADAVKSRSFGATEKNLWLMDGLFQRVAFWLMVADIVTDFTFEWASGIYKAGYCTTAAASQAQGHLATYNSHDTAPTSWTLGFPGSVEYVRNAALFQGDAPQLIAARRGHASLTWRIDNNGFSDGWVTLGLKDGNPLHTQTRIVDVPMGGSAVVTFFSLAPGDNFLAVLGQASSTGPFLATLMEFNLVGTDPVPTP